MTEETDTTDVPNERDTLLARARDMNLSFSNNIGTDKLREKVNAALAPKNAPVEESLFHSVGKAAAKLIRVVVTNNNPNKKHAEGEWFKVGNSILPTIKTFVPFGVTTHVPQAILNVLKTRKYTSVEQPRKSKYKGLGEEMKAPPKRLRNEFVIEILEPLTQKELDALATQQSRREAVDLNV